MSFNYHHIVRFHETDGAGVVYFANGLVMCHSAYEASLAAADIAPQTFFQVGALVFPIVHASLDFYRPLRCGDGVMIQLRPAAIDGHSYEIHYRLMLETTDRPVAIALTRHICIEPTQRQRQPLPSPMQHWLQRWGES